MSICRRNFLKTALAGCFVGPSLLSQTLQTPLYPDNRLLGESLRKVWDLTTLKEKICASNFIERALGLPIAQHMAGGENLSLRTELGTLSEKANPRTLLFFGQITDAHVLDEESPGRLVSAEPFLEKLGVTTAFRPQEDLTLAVLEAMMQTLNNIASRGKLDFLLNTGDSIDNAQENELSMFLQTLQGGEVDPDSGLNEDPVPGAGNDANDPFQATGFLAGLPCYSALGNHDVLLQGTVPAALREIYNSIVQKIMDAFVLQNAVGNYSNAVLQPWATPPDITKLKAGLTIADARRRNITGKDFILKHLQMVTNRPMFGFPQSLMNKEEGYYALYPKAGLPLKLIVLDTPLRVGTAYGNIDNKQLQEFLIPELEKSKKAGELVMIASHHPSKDIKSLEDIKQEMLWQFGREEKVKEGIEELFAQIPDRKDSISGKEFEQLLASYPNVFLHIAGHCHTNAVTPIGQKGRGYWQIMTASLLDFPQQARLFEIVHEGDTQGAIQTCIVDHASAPGSLSAYSRTLAYKDATAPREKNRYHLVGEVQDRNTILPFSIPSEIAKKL